ncbi:MAG: amidohydrolase [Chloroherpetonaceae bacterium]|nr:amidohydrolase [Chloroherpetonaceae bacterium]MDW8465926.1 amidohydrolase [Chloroherpetonaceae bacterium]
MPSPSLLITNAVIANCSGYALPYRALLIRDGLIAQLFTDGEPKVRKVEQRLDARGHLLLPSFCDSHTHFSEYGLRLLQLDLSGLSHSDALCCIRQHVAEMPKGSWIVGGGWTKQAFGTFPTPKELDDISTEHFIALRSADWHSAWCNTPVLAQLNATDFSAEELPRAEDGTFTSVAFERAAKAAMALVKTLPAERQAAILRAQAAFFKLGITETLSMENADALSDYQALGSQLKLRVRIGIYLESLDAAKKFYATTPHHNTELEAVKLFLDGSLGSETCSMLEPFENSRSTGMDFYADADLVALFRLIEREHLAISVHAIGDKAVRRALNAFERLANSSSLSFQLAHRIEHAQTVHTSDLPRFARLGVIASMQPIHIRSDIEPAMRLLGARAERLYRFRSLLSAGTTLLFGSDAPVESPNVLEGLFYAVARQDATGRTWYAEERLSLPQALEAYTLSSRRIIDARRGLIEQGYQADLIVLSENIFRIPAERLPSVQVLATILGGEIVHSIL